MMSAIGPEGEKAVPPPPPMLSRYGADRIEVGGRVYQVKLEGDQGKTAGKMEESIPKILEQLESAEWDASGEISGRGTKVPGNEIHLKIGNVSVRLIEQPGVGEVTSTLRTFAGEKGTSAEQAIQLSTEVATAMLDGLKNAGMSQEIYDTCHEKIVRLENASLTKMYESPRPTASSGAARSKSLKGRVSKQSSDAKKTSGFAKFLKALTPKTVTNFYKTRARNKVKKMSRKPVKGLKKEIKKLKAGLIEALCDAQIQEKEQGGWKSADSNLTIPNEGTIEHERLELAKGQNHGVAVLSKDDVRIKPAILSAKPGKKLRKLVKKQLGVLQAGLLSAKERPEIRNEVATMVGKMQATITPISKISSSDRNSKLRNLSHTGLNVVADQQSISSHMRHAIVETEDMAKELLQSQVKLEMTELQERLGGVAIDPKKTFEITLSSVSLVSPDMFLEKYRGLIRRGRLKWQNEGILWQQQLKSLQSLEGVQEVAVDGKKIKVKVNVLPYNFGVNKFAAHRLVKHKGGYGHKTSHQTNRETVKKAFGKDGIFDRLNDSFKEIVGGGVVKGFSEDAELQSDFRTFQKEYDAQKNDILRLTKNQASYIATGDQYECPAKLASLADLANNFRNSLLAKATTPDQKTALLQSLPPSIRSSFNCMSGKDRTGVLDGCVKAMAVMRAHPDVGGGVGHAPSHDELTNNLETRKLYAKQLLIFMADGGGLDVTEWNTGVRGYKVGDEFLPWNDDGAFWDEVWGELGEDMQHRLEGLSKITGH